MAGARDYSPTAASNLSVGGISIAEGWLPAAVNNSYRAGMADIANLLLDHGGAVTTTGSAGSFAISLPSAPTAYADNLLFIAKLNHDATNTATMNVNGLGAKDFKQVVNGVAKPMTAGTGPAGHLALCVYSSADTAILMLNSQQVIVEEAGGDFSSNVYKEEIVLPDTFSVPTTGEWYTNEGVSVLRGSFLVTDEEAGHVPPYHGDYGGWMPLLFARNYATTSDPTLPTYAHAQTAEGTPKVYMRGGLVVREENDTIDLAFDRLNFDGAGNIAPPPTVDPTSVMRAYSRMAGVDHFNVPTADGTPHTITAINIGTGEITCADAHALGPDDRCVIVGVGGTTQLNTSGEGYRSNGYVIASVPSSLKVTLKTLAGVPINMTGWGTFTSGGTLTKAAPHIGIWHPGGDSNGRFAVYQQHYEPAADYFTTGRFSGWHEFLASKPATATHMPGALEIAARIKAPVAASGRTGLNLYVWDGTTETEGPYIPATTEREVRTKALGDLDPSDRVLYIDQAEPGTGRIIPYSQTLNDSVGRTLLTSHNGYTIFSGSNPSRITFTGPTPYPEGLRYRFVSAATGGVRFVVGSGTIRHIGSAGTQVLNSLPRDGDSIVVESVSTAIFYIVSMVGAWEVS